MGSIFTILSAFIGYKLFKVQTDSILSLLSIFVIVLNSISSTTFIFDSKGYGKFIRSIPRSYEKHRNVLFLNIFIAIFSFFIFYFITGTILKIFLKEFQFNIYMICYILFIGLFLSGISVSTVTLKDGKFMTPMIGVLSIIFNKFFMGFREPEYWYVFIKDDNVTNLQRFEHILKSPQTIMLLTLLVGAFLMITYKIALLGIRKRW
jgi:hypothetical protein